MRFLCIFVVLLAHLHSGASTTAGNGTGNLDWRNDGAWFVQKKSFNYCLRVSSDFGVSKVQVEPLIESALKSWTDYVNSRFVHGYKFSITTVGKRNVTCLGNEDLTFYLGETPPSVELARASYLYPLAFAHREIYDISQRWGRGYIWLAPAGSVPVDTSRFREPYLGPVWTAWNLKAVLLHELGHVFGNGHAYGTIMRPDLAAFLRPSEAIDSTLKDLLSSVEYESELVSCSFKKCSRRWQHRTCRFSQIDSARVVEWLENEFEQPAREMAFSIKVVDEENVVAVLDVVTSSGNAYSLDVTDLRVLSASEERIPQFKIVHDLGTDAAYAQSSIVQGKLMHPDGRGKFRKVTISRNFGPKAPEAEPSCLGQSFFIGFEDQADDHGPRYFFGATAQ